MDCPFLTTTIFILLIISLCTLPASGVCDAKERDSLLAIKKSLGNPPSLSSWNVSADCCGWTGVSCDDTHSKHVVALYIRSQRDVNGTIPPEIGNLPELSSLSLDHLPGLHGQIPSTIGRTKLEFMYIHHTKLSGPIPSSFGSLKIAHFDLHHCKLTGPIPASITQIPTLRRLDLSHNKLSGQIPPFTRKLRTSLTDIDLSHNRLSGKIPPSIKYLDDLDTLVLSHNKLSGALLTGLPSRLTKIDVGNNRLTGALQKSTFAKVTGILDIDLSMNLLEGDASMLFNVNPSWLQKLNISWNNFSFDFGSVDKFADTFWALDASHNQLFGAIPASLGSVQSMNTLDLSHNRLAGRIPSNSLPSQLTWAKLDHNNFTGEIPQSILNNTGVLEIDVSHNKFVGDASSMFRKDELNQVINLSWNMLSFNLSKVEFSFAMQRLDLSHNLIYGSIPSQIVTLELLQELDVSYNLLTGEIPQGGKMSSFNRSSFDHNRCLCGHPLDPCPCTQH